jgi:hypothetical protein
MQKFHIYCSDILFVYVNCMHMCTHTYWAMRHEEDCMGGMWSNGEVASLKTMLRNLHGKWNKPQMPVRKAIPWPKLRLVPYKYAYIQLALTLRRTVHFIITDFCSDVCSNLSSHSPSDHYNWRNIKVNIVTRQPIVGLRNSECSPLLSASKVNRFPRAHDGVTLQ